MRAKILRVSPVLLLLCACEEQPEPAVQAWPAEVLNSAHWRVQAVPVSAQCGVCHRKEFADWAGSDHAWALRELNSVYDTEPFHRQRLRAHGSELTFAANRKGELLLTDSQSKRNFKVDYVLGRRPLVQYLVKGEDGGWHTPSAAWDVLRHEWFDMFEDDSRLSAEGLATRNSGDWGHWLGRGMNWNSQCAWCHTSHFRKNYNEAADTYASTWKEPGVTCIQCHKLAAQPSADGCMVAPQQRVLTAKQMHDNCATCHARREELDEQFVVGNQFDDHFRLELPTIRGIFYPNGMQQDEDYCETGLRLSRMGAAGVTCLDCHDPHTATLKLPQEDNSLCLRCHAAGTPVNGTPTPIIDMATHTPCPQGSMGARCVECHMPESHYMARDPRRDHSFNSPDPQLSAELGIPNACTMCHKDMDNARAAEVVSRTYPQQKMAAVRERTRAVHAAMQGRACTETLLQAYAAEPVPAWRATLLELMAQQTPTAAVLQTARAAAQAPEAMVRAAAARVLGEEALPLVKDPVKLVRRAAAWPLIDRLVQLPEYAAAVQEQEHIARHRADQPNGAMQLAVLATVRGQTEEADRQYRRAISLDPAGLVAYMDYAVFLARCQRLSEALNQMLAASKVAPENAEVQYRIGLILAEMQQYEYAYSAFERALKLDADHESARRNFETLKQYLRK
ncbi:MAG: hypothetical protein IKZ10_08030 [Akkermansia sp.]|nr:hypothetical protein [Akkermansia sp.]